jgi:nondiscriminating aspartyl-tRNA synthetase
MFERRLSGEEMQSEILRLLKLHSFSFEYLIHQEVIPLKVAQEVGANVCEGVKCLILRGKKSEKNFLFCLLGHQKVDMRAVAEIVGENCEFEKTENVKEKFGLSVGGIPPFGNLLGIGVYFEMGIQGCKEVIFSSGLITGSIRMKQDDLIALVQPRFATFAKS